MKKILIVLLAMVLLLAGCGKNGTSSPQSPSDESVADQQEPSSSETEISSEDHAIPGSYTVPDGWEKSEKHSTDSQIFYIEEGHENDEKPDNISIHVGNTPSTGAIICPSFNSIPYFSHILPSCSFCLGVIGPSFFTLYISLHGWKVSASFS